MSQSRNGWRSLQPPDSDESAPCDTSSLHMRLGDLHDRGLAWDILFELGTSSAPFTHAVRIVSPHDLRDRPAIVQL
jgi:hypothetical protein